MRQFARLKQQNSRKVARMVAQHWDRQLGTSEREKKAEEKRLRALAKWTLREVLKQWRLAVNVVRARKAAAEKAEKDKLDKEQLNAILEQSTAMLKKQHEVMTRADEGGDSDSEIGSDSDRTSYGSDGTPEPEDSDAEDEVVFATPEAEEVTEVVLEAEDAESVQNISTPATRDPSPSLTPAVEVQDNEVPSTPDNAEASHINGDSTATLDAEPTTTRRSRRSTRGVAKASIKDAKLDSKLDPNDKEFDVGADDAEQEDAELERKMWRKTKRTTAKMQGWKRMPIYPLKSC